MQGELPKCSNRRSLTTILNGRRTSVDHCVLVRSAVYTCGFRAVRTRTDPNGVTARRNEAHSFPLARTVCQGRSPSDLKGSRKQQQPHHSLGSLRNSGDVSSTLVLLLKTHPIAFYSLGQMHAQIFQDCSDLLGNQLLSSHSSMNFTWRNRRFSLLTEV